MVTGGRLRLLSLSISDRREQNGHVYTPELGQAADAALPAEKEKSEGQPKKPKQKGYER